VLAERLGQFCFWQAADECGRERPRTFRMETAPPQLLPGPEVLVQRLNESSADEPGGGSADQTTPEILTERA
jgi:hypothetical protein